MFYLIYAIAIFMGGLIQSSLGFGLVIFALPIIALTTPPKVAIPFLLTLATFNTIIVAYKSRQDIQVGRIWPLIPAGILGIPLGTIVLLHANSNFIKILIGLTTILFAVIIVKANKPIAREKIGLLPVGLISGILQGSIGMSGPPVILFFSNQNMEKKPFRASLIAFFLVLNIATLIGYVFTGLITKQILVLSGLYLPVLILGTLTGMLIFKKIKNNLFRKLVTASLIFLGIFTIITSLG